MNLSALEVSALMIVLHHWLRFAPKGELLVVPTDAREIDAGQMRAYAAEAFLGIRERGSIGSTAGMVARSILGYFLADMPDSVVDSIWQTSPAFVSVEELTGILRTVGKKLDFAIEKAIAAEKANKQARESLS